MKLSSFYNQVRQDHGEAIQGLRYKNTLPNFKDYKSVKAISSNGITVVLMSNLGDVKVETRYYIKDKNKKAESVFFLFNDKIATLTTQLSEYSWIYKFNVHILGCHWLSRTTFKHLNMLFNTYEVTTTGHRAIGPTLRAFTRKHIGYLGKQELNEYKDYEVMYY